ncbi:MAG TPA: alkaline phosphatase family protein [Rhizomicrobium sp.]|nr:alkaline phosphatase family protein [Rhizomicrobium sp.]
MDVSLIKTIVIVMMENRSFDNLLGYLCLPPYNRANVQGLGTTAQWRDQVASLYQGAKYPPFLLTDPYDVIDADPPHERDPIAVQMGTAVAGVYPMNGFVTNYATAQGAKPVTPGSHPPVMGYFSVEQAPVTDFFAENYAICDRWFSALPAGTQPNRLMAMSGFTKIDVNQVPLPDQELVYDWLTRNNIRWRVYHEDMPFFSMMLRWIPDILLENHFRPFAQLYDDVQNETPDKFPQVIFVEPTYTDAPHLGLSSDDHAPSAIKGGQKFLLEVYRAMTRVPDVWRGTVMVVTYDEHGGFFDHVSPPALKTVPPTGASWQNPFVTLGVRVPGFVISPFVNPGTVFSSLLDHTSILKFIGQKFGPDGKYSDLVSNRPVGSVLDVLNASDSQRPAAAIPSLNPYLSKDPMAAGFTPGSVPKTQLQDGFQRALDTIRTHPEKPPGKFDELLASFPPRPGVA